MLLSPCSLQAGRWDLRLWDKMERKKALKASMRERPGRVAGSQRGARLPLLMRPSGTVRSPPPPRNKTAFNVSILVTMTKARSARKQGEKEKNTKFEGKEERRCVRAV